MRVGILLPLVLVLISFGNCAYAQCVIPDTPGPITGAATLCAGTSGTYSMEEISGATSYTWTLPDGWTGTSTTNSINVTANSTGGNISVTASNACGTSEASSLALTIDTAPATPGSIAGTTTFCVGTPVTYSIEEVLGATSYTWTLPAGMAGISTTNSINTVTDPNVFTGSSIVSIAVTASNACGTSAASSQEITVNAPPVTPGPISGASSICAGTTNTYSVAAVSGATSYTWTLPGGWTGTSTTNSIDATANSSGGNISVIASNACETSDPSSLTIIVNSPPVASGPITGATTLCAGASGTYSIEEVEGATSYTWTLPGGWTGTSTTNSIDATASATTGQISVTASNACGAGEASTLAVTNTPTTPGSIAGPTTFCPQLTRKAP